MNLLRIPVKLLKRLIHSQQPVATILRKTHLRRRGKHTFHKNSNCSTIHPDRLNSPWPAEIQQRKRIGDWEDDTVYAAVSKGLIVTLADCKVYLKDIFKLLNSTARLDETKSAYIEI